MIDFYPIAITGDYKGVLAKVASVLDGKENEKITALYAKSLNTLPKEVVSFPSIPVMAELVSAQSAPNTEMTIWRNTRKREREEENPLRVVKRRIDGNELQSSLENIEAIRSQLKLPDLNREPAELNGISILNWIIDTNCLTDSAFARMLGVDVSWIYNARLRGIKGKLADLLALLCGCQAKQLEPKRIKREEIILPDLEGDQANLQDKAIIDWILKENQITLYSLETILDLNVPGILNPKTGKIKPTAAAALSDLFPCDVERLREGVYVYNKEITRENLQKPPLQEENGKVDTQALITTIKNTNRASFRTLALVLEVPYSSVWGAVKGKPIRDNLCYALGELYNCSDKKFI